LFLANNSTEDTYGLHIPKDPIMTDKYMDELLEDATA
jgi:hypothetical protein